MDYYMNSAGISVPCIREYETDTDKDLAKGTVVTLANGKAVKASEGDVVLGILAEDYKTEKSELDPTCGSGRVKVIISAGMICRTKAPEFAVETAGNETTVNVAGLSMPSVADAFKGGFVQLVSKAESSTNTDHAGSLRHITASAGTKLTVENGGVSCPGDIYRILPPAGFKYISLDENATGTAVSSAEGKTFKVACSDEKGGFTEVVFTNTFFN